jgi:hypothetical protein
VHSTDTAIICLVFKVIGVIVIVILTSLVLLLSSCQTPEIEPEPCPVCHDPSLAEIEVCEIEKAELTQKHEDCLESYYRSELRNQKAKKTKKVKGKKK